MHNVYKNLIEAAEGALEPYGEIADLIEYPEVQADKAYFLSILEKYNFYKSVQGTLEQLKAKIDELDELDGLLAHSADDEKDDVYAEISAARKAAGTQAARLASLLKQPEEAAKIICRIKADGTQAVKVAMLLSSLIRGDLEARGAKLDDGATVCGKDGESVDITFFADGESAFARVAALAGAHRVIVPAGKNQQAAVAVTFAEKQFCAPPESELKIDIFHSGGAGGQNINKVETAVRITHIPTGTVVTCQDERSQLKNKQRALETLIRRLYEREKKQEKSRVDGELKAQLNIKNTAIAFNLTDNTFTDARLSGGAMPFPPDGKSFALYIDTILATGK